MQSIQSAYTPNYSTGLYQFSPLFVEQTFDLQHWRMTATFLAEFPELKDDILCAVDCAEPDDSFGFETIGEVYAQNMPMNTSAGTAFFAGTAG